MAPRRKTLVMVIEDDPDCREAVCAALEYDDYAVVEAADGSEALRYLESNAPHALPGLILLDLMMPVMNGREFLAAQRSRPALANIPVALLSGEARLAEGASELGVAEHLSKPIDLDALLAAVRRLTAPSDGSG
jgi:CheY-like chemotaxis protein